jgi:hypothetical protein
MIMTALNFARWQIHLGQHFLLPCPILPQHNCHTDRKAFA